MIFWEQKPNMGWPGAMVSILLILYLNIFHHFSDVKNVIYIFLITGIKLLFTIVLVLTTVTVKIFVTQF